MHFRNCNSREGFDWLSCILISLSKRAAHLAPLALRNFHTASPLLPLYNSLFFAPLSLLNTHWTFFQIPWLTLTQTYTYTLHFCLLSGGLPAAWVIVVFRVRQEPQSLRPPQCLPGSAAAIIRQLVWLNRLKQLWKTALAVTRPASSSSPTEKQYVGKTTQWVEQWSLLAAKTLNGWEL